MLHRFIHIVILPLVLCAALPAAGQEAYFRQGRAGVDAACRHNGAAVDSLRASAPAKLSAGHRLFIKGLASPEGGVFLNDTLSLGRARAFWAAVGHGTEPNVWLQGGGRNWHGLRQWVETHGETPSQRKVIALLDTIVERVSAQGSDSEANLTALRVLDGGVPYAYLYRRAFPSLRKAVATWLPPAIPAPAQIAAAECLPQGRTTAMAQGNGAVATAGLLEIETFPTHTTARRPWYMALKTNMLYDAAVVPNLGVEAYLGKRWSAGVNAAYIWIRCYSRNRHWRIEGGDVYLRRWFGHAAGRKPLTGHHLGVTGGLYTFQIETNSRRGFISGIPGEDLGGSQPAWCAGVEYGYSLPLARRLNMDFTLGMGYFQANVRQYRPTAPPPGLTHLYEWERTRRIKWFGPIKAEISLVWLIGHGNVNGR